MRRPSFFSAIPIEPAPVFNYSGTRLGSIKQVVIDRNGGCVVLAVLTLGALFPIGERLYPVPWELLDYDDAKEAFVAHLDRQNLRRAIWFEPAKLPDWDRTYDEIVASFP